MPLGCGRALTDSVVAKPHNEKPTASAAFRPIYGGLPATRHTNRAALLRLICRDSWCTSEANERCPFSGLPPIHLVHIHCAPGSIQRFEHQYISIYSVFAYLEGLWLPLPDSLRWQSSSLLLPRQYSCSYRSNCSVGPMRRTVAGPASLAHRPVSLERKCPEGGAVSAGGYFLCKR